MKKLLLAGCLFLTFGVRAQSETNREAIKQKLAEAISKQRQQQRPGIRSFPLMDTVDVRQPLQSRSKAQRPPGVYPLALDNMPCMVPNTKDIAAMPNAAPRTGRVFHTDIPNAAHGMPLFKDELYKKEKVEK